MSSDVKIKKEQTEIEKKQKEIESKIETIKKTIQTITTKLSALNADLAKYNKIPDQHKQTQKDIKKLIYETNENIQNRIEEIDEIQEKIHDYDITEDDLNDYETQLNDIETFVKDWEQKINNEVPSKIKELKEKLEKNHKSNYSTKGIEVIKDTVSRRIIDKEQVYKNKDRLDTIEISLNQSSEEYTNNDVIVKSLKFKYSKNDYIILKNKIHDINFTIGKIDLIYKNNGAPVLYVKTIDPTDTLLNTGFLYLINFASKSTIDIFTNKYEIISINDNDYSYFPLVLFCNITRDIKDKLDAMFIVEDNSIYKLNINLEEDVISKFNIKTYFNDNLPFYGIDDDKIKTYFLSYLTISSNFSNYLKNNIYVNDKEIIKQQLNINIDTIDTISIQNNYFDLKTQYSELLKKMPIKLIPNIPKKLDNRNQRKNEILFEDELLFEEIYAKPNEVETNPNTNPDTNPDTNTIRKPQRLTSLRNPRNPLNKTQKRRGIERRSNELSLNP